MTSQVAYGYTDQEHLTDTALIHMNGRVYDPQIARFTSGDPLVSQPYSTQGWNRYAYVGNNPLNATDPTGWSSGPPPFGVSTGFTSHSFNVVQDFEAVSGSGTGLALKLGIGDSGEVGAGPIAAAGASGWNAGPSEGGGPPTVSTDGLTSIVSGIAGDLAANSQSSSGYVTITAESDNGAGSAPTDGSTAAAGTNGGTQTSQSAQSGGAGRDGFDPTNLVSATWDGTSGEIVVTPAACTGCESGNPFNEQYVPFDALPVSSRIILGNRQLNPDGSVWVGIPKGSVPRLADNGKGMVIQVPGSTGDANSMRVMDPNSYTPYIYIVYYNAFGQPISPYTGQTVGQSQWHYPFMGFTPQQ